MTDQTLFLDQLNHYVALATLIGFAIAVIWAIDLIMMKLGFLKEKRHLYESFSRYVFPIGFFVTAFATVMSLYYSYYLYIPACDLCWMQRIFIYPLTIIFALAWYKKDTRIYDYIMAISGVGFAIALYHHYLQMGFDLLAPCSTAPFAVDCSTPTFVEFGFITFPFTAVVTLGFAFLLALTGKVFQK